jgi:hypothetical protein
VVAYNVYAGATSNSEKLQNAVPIPIGLNWTEPVTGITTSGRVVPTTNTAAGSNGTTAGTQISVASVDTDATVLRSALLDSLKQLDKNNVAEGRPLHPAEARPVLAAAQGCDQRLHRQPVLRRSGRHREWQPADASAVPHHHVEQLPDRRQVAQTGENVDYSGDFTKSVAVVAHKSAVGT